MILEDNLRGRHTLAYENERRALNIASLLYGLMLRITAHDSRKETLSSDTQL